MSDNDHNQSREERDLKLADAVREIWRDLLRADPDEEPDFIRAGGSSMDALDMQLWLYKRTGRKLVLESVPEPMTFQRIVASLQSSESTADVSSSRDLNARKTPATSTQISQWIIEQANPGSSAYAVPILVRFTNAVSIERLACAIARLTEVHPALRTTIRPVDGMERFEQVVHASNGVFPLECRSVVSLAETGIRPVLDEIFRTPPSIVRASPLRAVALRYEGVIRGLLFVAHHAAVDEWSIRVLVEDLGQLLKGENIPPERRMLADFSSKENIKDDLEWWENSLADVPSHVAFPRPEEPDIPSVCVHRVLAAADSQALDERCASLGVETSVAIVHAVGKAVGSLLSETPSQISIGVPMSLRDDPDLDRTVGMLLNTLPVSVQLDDVDSDHGLQKTRRQMREVRRHRFVPFDQLVKEFGPRRTDGRVPWLDVMVGFVDRVIPETDAYTSEVLGSGESAAPILVIARRQSNGEIGFEIQHVGKFVSPAFVTFVADAMIDELREPDRKTQQSPQASMVYGSEESNPETLVQLVERVANEHPDSIAIESEGNSVSFSELAEQSARIASSLIQRGLCAGNVIAIDLEPGEDFPIAVLGVLRAGCVAMPLAPDLPLARRKQLLERSGASFKLDREATQEAKTHPIAANLPSPDLNSGCYLLFTSGSTGEPKGVCMQHGPISNLVAFEVRRSSHASRTAMIAPLGFDVIFQEIFSTWGSAGTLVPVSTEKRRDPMALASFLSQKRITRIHASPVLLRALARAAVSSKTLLPDLCEVIAAGESLVVDDVLREMARASDGFVLVNQYGPTETHVATSIELGGDPLRWPHRPAIGTPIDGVAVRVVDQHARVVARGFPGELEIGGRGPAKGYLDGDPDERFTEDTHGRWYRTGDRARVSENGLIEFLGRQDDQVKISGHRVELGEIEHALMRIPGIGGAAVVVNQSEHGDALCGFVVSSDNADLDIQAVENSLRNTLPEFMVPRDIVQREALPVSSNGKINRRQLLESIHRRVTPEVDSGDLSAIGLLVYSVIGSGIPARDSSLAELGLDSLGAIRLQFELDKAFGIRTPVAEIMSSSVADLEAKASDGQGTEVPVMESIQENRPEVKGQVCALDPLEKDLVAEVAAAPHGAFHLAWRVEFDHEVDPEFLQQALHAMRTRNCSLRTARSARTGARVLDANILAPPRLEDLGSPPSADGRKGILRHPIDIENGECMRAATWLVRGRTTVLLVIHHAAIDGRGAEGVIAEFVRDVNELCNGEDLQIHEEHHLEYAFNERSDDVAWWIEKTRSQFGEHLPEIPRRLGPEGEADWTRVVDGERFAHIAHQHAREQGMPPAAPIIAAWAVMVGRLVGRDRVLIGVPFAVEPTNGASIRLGASMLPIAVDVSADRTLSDIIDDVAEFLVGGLDRRHAAFGSIAREFAEQKVFPRTPLDAVLTINAGNRVIGGASVSWEPTGVSPFQAALVVEGEEFHSLLTQVERGLLCGETIESFGERFSLLLNVWYESLESTQANSLTVADLPLLSDMQSHTLDVFESGGPSPSIEPSVPARFSAMAARTPDAPAIITKDVVINYSELDRWATSLSMKLLESGLGSGDKVAFLAHRCPEAIATMLGIARSGCVYVPIDPSIPELRRMEQLKDASVECVVVFDVVKYGHALGVDRVVVLPDRFASSKAADAASLPELNPDSGLYVMFTSGTTGESKGSLVSHGGVLRLVCDQPFLYTNGPLRMLNAAPLAFDASTLEIWAPLLSGGCLSTWEGRGADLAGISERIVRDQVNAVWLTSALFQAAADGVANLFDTLQVVLTGGDVVSAEHVRRVQERCPGLVVVNGYGPTENTVFTTCEVIAPGSLHNETSVSIGGPIPGTTVRIVDDHGQRVPAGGIGEIVAGGAGVAIGYVGGDSESRFYTKNNERFYRTGDLARWRPDGRIEFHGRRDGQVKISGRRVEYGAIESAFRRCPGVADACVSSIGEGSRRKLIAAIAGDDSSISVAAVRKWVGNVLPAGEVPSTIVAVPLIPVTANGKPDRRAVSELVEAVPVTQGEAKGDDELIAIVMDVISETLGKAPQSLTQQLVDAGIDSLDMVRITLALGDRLARPVELGEVIQGGDVAGIASRMRSDISREAENIVALRGSPQSDHPAVYCIPGVGGTVFSYGSMLDAIDSDIPVLGLPYPGLSGGQIPLDSVDALAERFANLIVQDRPAQVIVGYSLGGFIAFETARRVHELTGMAPSVLVIDSAPVLLPSWRWLRGRTAIRTEIRMQLESVLPPGVVALLRGRRKATTLASLRSVVAAGFRAVRTYDPELAALDVLLLRTSETKFGGAEDIEDLGWSRIAAKIRVKQIDGRHLEVFRGSTGMDIALAITEEYNRAGRLVMQRRQSFRSSRG